MTSDRDYRLRSPRGRSPSGAPVVRPAAPRQGYAANVTRAGWSVLALLIAEASAAVAFG